MYLLGTNSMDNHQLAQFIVAAKKATYASQDDNFSQRPLLPGSKYLTFEKPPFFYCDTYFGMSNFAGQEVVYYQDIPIWSMCYRGGVISAENTHNIYVFLRKALMSVPLFAPFRGIPFLCEGELQYLNKYVGDIENFSGEEYINQNADLVYRLTYIGGLLS
ncbi:hypothetical protein BFS14_22245 [Serratia fonticola]|nr:hypothetical protein BFS14_22245 [Serratia fonticola]